MKCIFPGSFDPFHKGHLDLIKKAAKIFKKIIIVVANNEKKNHKYSLKIRKSIIKKELKKTKFNCKVIINNEKYLANFIKKYKINYYIRGLRNKKDFEYEQNLFYEYKKIKPDLELVLFIANKENKTISSSLTK